MNRRGFIKYSVLLALSLQAKALNSSVSVKKALNRVEVIDISSESSEGGHISCYFESEKLVKVVKSQCFESGRYDLDILLRGDQLFQVKERSVRYNVPFYITEESAKEIGSKEHFDVKKSKVEDVLVYFSEGVAVKSTGVENLPALTKKFNSLIDGIRESVHETGRT